MRTLNFILFSVIIGSFSAFAGETVGIYTKKNIPRWRAEMNERARELEQLQRQNGAGSEHVTKTDFPKTINDLSFSARTQLERESLEPYKDNVAYQGLNVKTESEWCKEHLNSPECAKYKAKTQQQQQNVTQNDPNTNNTNPNLSSDENTAINAIVEFLNPQNNEEKRFFTDLATDFVPKAFKDDDLILDNSFVYNFLADNDGTLTKYKNALTTLSGTAESEELHIDLDWDEILIQISTILDATLTRRGALVCENNRSYQVGIDTVLWVATAAAAIASFGTGGVAAASGHAALGAGLKALAKGASKVGLKTAGKSLTKKGSKQLAKASVKIGLRTSIRGWNLPSVQKNISKNITKRIAKKAGENLKTKRGILLTSGAVAGAIYETAGKSGIANKQKSKKEKRVGFLYSLVESKPSTEIIGCQDLDYGEGCYAVCGYDKPDDDLNTKIFKPLLGHTYCVSESDFTLYDTETNKPLMLNSDDYVKVTQKIRSEITDKGKVENVWKTVTNQKNGRHGCDWNEDDIDMYFGSYIYNPDTMEPSSNMIVEEVIRIDD